LTPTAKKNAQRATMIRFAGYFLLCLLAGFAILLAPFTQPAFERATASLVTVCAFVVRLFGGSASAHLNLLLNPVNGYSIEVKDTCNASNVTLMLWAAILAFPAPWIKKGKGLLAGTLAIHVLNLIRIISLFYLGQYNTSWFDFAHLYVWESLIMLGTMVIFSLWVRTLHSR
jgi:exosortase H (IPTLxxWG-CTERM-specific)